MKFARTCAAIAIAALISVMVGTSPAGAAPNNSASIWYLSGPVQPNGYALCRTTVTHQNNIFGTSSPGKTLLTRSALTRRRLGTTGPTYHMGL